MNGGIPERKQTVRASMCASLNRPRSFVREMWRTRSAVAETSGCACEDDIVKYSVDPALTDIRGELSGKMRKLIWVVTPAVGPFCGRQPFLYNRKFRGIPCCIKSTFFFVSTGSAPERNRRPASSEILDVCNPRIHIKEKNNGKRQETCGIHHFHGR